MAVLSGTVGLPGEGAGDSGTADPAKEGSGDSGTGVIAKEGARDPPPQAVNPCNANLIVLQILDILLMTASDLSDDSAGIRVLEMR